MPFNSNPTSGTVVYTDGAFNSNQVVTEDWETDAAGYGPAGSQTAATNEGATYRTITPLEIPIGKYERMVIKYHIHWEQNTTGRAKFKLDTPTVTSINSAIVGVEPDGTSLLDIDAAADPVKEVDVAGTSGFFEWESVIENGATAGTVSFQFGQVANNAAPVIVLEGSYVEIKKF